MYVHSFETNWLLSFVSEIFLVGYLCLKPNSAKKSTNMEENIMNLVVFGVISWSTIFLLTRRVFPKLSFDFCNRVVSTIHAILAVILASLTVQDWRCPVCPLASKSSPKQVFYLTCLLFYANGGFPEWVRFGHFVQHT